MKDKSNLDLLAAIGAVPEKKKKAARSPKEARIIAGFEEIQRFVAEQGHLPRHGPELDIFERLYAVRLDRLRAQSDCRELLEELDSDSLLKSSDCEDDLAQLGNDALLAALGLEAKAEKGSITTLSHVRSAAEKREAAEEIADRKPCKDFAKFEQLFKEMREDLESKRRSTQPYSRAAGNSQTTQIEQGQFYVLNGVSAYVADIENLEQTKHRYQDGRLRVIFDNGTESNLLFQSFHRALREDPGGRLVSEPEAGPLFEDPTSVEGDRSGTIYVLSSWSDDPFFAKNRPVLHKIGVTRGDVKKRISNAQNDPTFLCAGVKIEREYPLYDLDRLKLENLLHRFFAPARLELSLGDRFDKKVNPREWFLVSLPAIEEAIERIRDKSLHLYRYDPSTARILEV